MARAPLVPTFTVGGAPVSILVDYDGTVSLLDVGDTLLARHVADRAALTEQDRRYEEGRIGSRELMLWDMAVLPADAGLLRAEAASIGQDEGLVRLVAIARGHGAAVEIVSDGLGFYVEPKLAELGLADLPVVTNENRLEAPGRGMAFPYGHPRCFVCGTCKRERVRAHQAAHRAVVYIGDGTSDRFAAAHADVVFAKDSLARICRDEGWPYHAWKRLADVADWLSSALTDGRLPESPDGFDAWRSRYAPGPRPFICGPEVWGEGRTAPGPGPR
ncbi:MAG TPA: HAD-IB family phosphatase [Candidatus Limnocylindrales bacterium]|nr:HAD-IB family phosphatase [Candidatus Limnocylindrales bacterium]